MTCNESGTWVFYAPDFQDYQGSQDAFFWREGVGFTAISELMNAQGLLLPSGSAVLGVTPDLSTVFGVTSSYPSERKLFQFPFHPDMVPTGTVRGRVTDSVTGEPLAFANVTVSGVTLRATTDADGRFEIDDMPDGDVDIAIAAAQSEYHAEVYRIRISPSSGAWLTAQLRPDDEPDQIVSVKGTYFTPEKRVYFYDGEFDNSVTTGPLTEEFHARVDWGDGNPPGQVEFITPHGTFPGTPTDGSFKVYKRTFNMEQDFGAGGKLFVRAIPEDGPPTRLHEANMLVIPKPPGTNIGLPDIASAGFSHVALASTPTYRTRRLSLSFKPDGLSANVIPTAVPILGGAENKIGCSAEVGVTLRGDGTADAVASAGFQNVSRPDLSGAGPLRLGGFSFSLSGSAGVAWRYVEGTHEWLTGGTMGAQLGFEASLPAIPRQQVVIVGPVPIPYFLQARADIGLAFQSTITGFLEDDSVKATGVINLDPLVRLRLMAALGLVDIANIYVTGAIGERMRVEPALTPAIRSMSIFGAVVVGAQFGPFKTERQLGEISFNLLQAASASAAGWSATQHPTLSLVDRSYGAAPGGMNSFVANKTKPAVRGTGSITSDTPFELNVFNESAPAVVTFGPHRLMVWQQDDPTRTPTNRTRLMWSFFDYYLDQWSEPAPITEDGTADLRPRLCKLSNGSVMCIWEDVKEVLAEPANPNDPAQVLAKYAEFKSKTEISAAIFSLSSQPWSAPVRLTDDAVFDQSPRVSAASDGTAIAVWTSNAFGNETGSATEPSSIRAASFNGSAWSTTSTLASGIPSMLKRELVHSPARSVFVYSADTDGDALSSDDRELFVVSRNGGVWSGPTRATNDAVADSSPCVYWDACRNGFGFAWKRGNNIVDGFDTLAAPRLAVELPHASAGAEALVLASNGAACPTLALVWQEQSDALADLHLAFYEGATDSWSKPYPLTADEAMESMPALTFMPPFVSNGGLFLAYDKTAVGTETHSINIGGQQEQVELPTRLGTDLYTLTFEAPNDLGVLAEEIFMDPPNPVPGDHVTTRATIHNNGVKLRQGVRIQIVAESSVVLDTQIDLAGGAAQDVQVEWNLPAPPVGMPEVKVLIDPLSEQPESESNYDNNTVVVPTRQRDISVLSVTSEQVGPSNWMIVTRVHNNGGAATPPTQVTLHEGGSSGPLLATLEVPNLYPGAFYDAPWLWEGIGNLRGTGPRDIAAVIDPQNLLEEFNEDDNVTRATINPNVPPFPPPPPCPTDLNHDGAMNTLDLILLLQHFGQNVVASQNGDINGDATVNTLDLILLLQKFGQACPS